MPAAARALIEEPDNQIIFSAISLVEISIKRSLQEPGFTTEPRRLRDRLLGSGFAELAFDGDHAVALRSLPWLHKDPFDRMLIAQAVASGLTLLTVDSRIAAYPGPIHKV